MTNYAVLIGNNEFAENSGLEKLSCPPHDVAGMKAVLTAENRGLFLAENVAVLINKTSSEVLQELNGKLKQKALDNLFFLYYSGHGLSSGNDLYLTTKNTREDLLDSTAIPFEQIYNWINKFYWTKVIIILDCCYSGLAGNAFKTSISAQLQSMNNQAMGTFLITATSNEKVAFDKTEGSRFSLFTKHLITALESDEAETNEQGFISMDSLFRYVSKKVTDEKPEQRPKRFVKNEMGELFIAKSGRQLTHKDLLIYFYTLKIKGELPEIIFREITVLIDKGLSNFSYIGQHQFNLAKKCYDKKLTLIEFIKQWNELKNEAYGTYIIGTEGIGYPNGHLMWSSFSYGQIFQDNSIKGNIEKIDWDMSYKIIEELNIHVRSENQKWRLPTFEELNVLCSEGKRRVENNVIGKEFFPTHIEDYWFFDINNNEKNGYRTFRAVRSMMFAVMVNP